MRRLRAHPSPAPTILSSAVLTRTFLSPPRLRPLEGLVPGLGQVGCQEQSGEGPSDPLCPAPPAIASTLGLLNGSESARLFAVSRQRLPRCIRCAVVGNGGILNGSRQGQNIDAHDYVFRYVQQGPGRRRAAPQPGAPRVRAVGGGSSRLRQLSSRDGPRGPEGGQGEPEGRSGQGQLCPPHRATPGVWRRGDGAGDRAPGVPWAGGGAGPCGGRKPTVAWSPKRADGPALGPDSTVL